MDKKLLETLNKIRSLFNLDDIKQEDLSEKKVIKFSTDTLADGTIISWEGDGPLSVGVVISKDVEGTLTPLEDGEYPLQSGLILVIKDGILSEIKEPEPEEEVIETPIEESINDFNTLKLEIDELKNELKELKETIDNFSKAEKTLNSKIEKLSKSPDGEPLSQMVKITPLTEMEKKIKAIDDLRLSMKK